MAKSSLMNLNPFESKGLMEEKIYERAAYSAESPIPYEIYLDLSIGFYFELVNGVMVEKMSVQLTHEKLFAWLFSLLVSYVQERDLGIVLGSRTAVQINDFGGRLPDLLFVKRERQGIVKERAVYGAPDLVIEIRSPNDFRAEISALEADYRLLQVNEIWFIDPKRKQVRVLRRREERYEEATLTAGTLRSEAVAGFYIELEWLFQNPAPSLHRTLTRLLTETAS